MLRYEMLTGEVLFASAFETGDPMVMMNAVCNQDAEIPEDCPRKMALCRALAKEPSQRFASCVEFIEAAAKSDTAQTGGIEASRDAEEKHGRRGVRAAPVMAALCVVALALVAVGGWRWHEAKESARIAAEKKVELERIVAAQRAEAERLAKAIAERAAKEKTAADAIPLPQGNDRLLYCVVDLSGGPSASSYPVSYVKDVSAVPGGTFNTDEYKTTKLVLRRIEPGSFMMCGQYRVKLTRPYYIGVFEVTQKQYQLVTGNNPYEYKGDMRPVERISYDMLRGASKGAKWPSSSDVDESSFMGILQARTKLDFDLPTEAQWEFACRAGTKSEYNNGGDKEEDLKKLGRFALNQKCRGWKEPDAHFARHRPDNKGGCSKNHTVAGSYQPNRWGLYDMHGNVWEWCCDRLGGLTSGVTDPKGAAMGSARVLRGGCWFSHARYCRSAYRFRYFPGNRINNFGFRLCCSAGPRE